VATEKLITEARGIFDSGLHGTPIGTLSACRCCIPMLHVEKSGTYPDAKHACSDLDERDSGRLQIGGAFASSFSLNMLCYSITVDSSALRLFMFASSIASKIMIGK
jgi:hypothetical protein